MHDNCHGGLTGRNGLWAHLGLSLNPCRGRPSRGRVGIDAVECDPDVCSEQRTPVGLSNHPAQPNMATHTPCSRISVGRPAIAAGRSCPSDRLRAVADGTTPTPTRGRRGNVVVQLRGEPTGALSPCAGCNQGLRVPAGEPPTVGGCVPRAAALGETTTREDGGPGFDPRRLHAGNVNPVRPKPRFRGFMGPVGTQRGGVARTSLFERREP